jgi:hypothetical protein
MKSERVVKEMRKQSERRGKGEREKRGIGERKERERRAKRK